MHTLPSKTPSTTFIDVPYEVVLEAALGRFEDTKIKVEQHVLLGDRIVVSSASFEGYWYIPNDPVLTRNGTVPRAVFQPDTAASFTYHGTR
ncbi:hypothetical protein GCU60_17495 [Blastococcus saxobsidens]|uniref:Uncharacterized protein n=1 Tax=Blastococcus saxobsidens TaxID=138336 RepID=A0A6L9W6U9_9ACTN|nr:hypothetical protein [Blastococcus saxobsidens]NEK87539.1 hypothetical protein [Blastococcus saxobsidens]